MGTKLELTDDVEIEAFKSFRQHQDEILKEAQQWKELKAFVKNIGYGTLTLSVKNGLPYRVDNPIQTIVFGIKI